MLLAAYIRMSTDKQEDSPETQRSIITEYCEKNGHQVVEWYFDEGISGKSVQKRKELIRLLDEVENRTVAVEGVIFYKYDRAFRNLGEQIAVLGRLEKRNLKYIAVKDPGGDGAAGKLVTNILGAVNEFERELTGERIYDKNRQNAKKGKWTGSGIEPFGYHYDKELKKLVIVEKEAEIVKEIYNLYLEHRNTAKVAEKLNLNGKRTKLGNYWTGSGIRELIINPLYAGKRRWGYMKPNKSGKDMNFEIFDGDHEAIITWENYELAMDIMRSNRRPNGSKRIYLLSGLLKCLNCGGAAVGHTVQHLQAKQYRCSYHYNIGKDFCPGWNKVAYKIEEPVLEETIKNIRRVAITLDGPQNIKIVADNTDKKVAIVNKKISRLLDIYLDGAIDKDVYNQKKKSLELEKSKLLAKLEANKPKQISQETIYALNNFESLWENSNPDRKKRLLATVIKTIYTDGKIIRISFANLRIPGWKLEAETLVK